MMNTSHRDENRVWIMVLLLIFSVGIALRVWNIGHRALYVDEIHSLLYARNSVRYLLDIWRTTDIHPPLYFLTLKAWVALFGESREAARLFSIIFGVACIGLLFVIVRRLLGTPAALIASGFFATFPTTIEYARFIRMYPLLTFFFLVSFICFLEFYRGNPDQSTNETPRHRLLPLAGFSVSLALAFYTHYTAAILFMLYTLVSLYCLARGDKETFSWTFLGLFIATILVLPQLIHLFSSSLGDPDKSWMEATTWRNFYTNSMGAYPYPLLFKPIVFLTFLAGFVVLFRRDKTLAGIVLLFTVGGMVIAALIGIFEPMYLVRTIQIDTVFAGIPVAVALLWLPRPAAVLLGAALIAINIHAVQRYYLPERVALLADKVPEFVELLDSERDQVFAKGYLQFQMGLMRVPLFETAHAIIHAPVPLFETAHIITHTTQEAGITAIKTQALRCLGATGAADCRSVILILEKENLFDLEAIAAWNQLAGTLKASYPNHFEQLIAGYRIVAFSEDAAFLAQIAASLDGQGP